MQMTLQEQFNDLGAISRLERSGTIEKAMEETDFVTRAIRLLRLQDKIKFASWKSSAEVSGAVAKEGQRRAKRAGRVAFGVGLAVGAAVVAIAGAPLTVPGIIGMSIAGAFAGGIFRGFTRSYQKAAAEIEVEHISKKRSDRARELEDRVKSALQRMEDMLPHQEPDVREGYQAAFRHAEQRRKSVSIYDMPEELLDATEEPDLPAIRKPMRRKLEL